MRRCSRPPGMDWPTGRRYRGVFKFSGEHLVYASSDDLKGAMIFPQEWTGGAAYLSYATIVIGINQANLDWGAGAMVHELTHLVTHQMTRNPYGSLPNWLVEGLSMYAEGDLEFSFRATLVQALEDRSVISVRSLCSPFSANADESYLAYAQSYSLVDYLSEVHGQAHLAALLSVFKGGSDYDDAFMEIYGFNMEQLNGLCWIMRSGCTWAWGQVHEKTSIHSIAAGRFGLTCELCLRG